MICNKFVKAGGCNYPGNVRQLQRTFGQFYRELVDSNFCAIFMEHKEMGDS